MHYAESACLTDRQKRQRMCVCKRERSEKAEGQQMRVHGVRETNHSFDETELTVVRPATVIMLVVITRGSSFCVQTPVKQDSGTETRQCVDRHDHDCPDLTLVRLW